MPRVLSGVRYASSFLSPTGANEVEQEIDFQLGSDDGIRIHSVLGYGQYYDNTPAVSDTVPASSIGHQTLHLEQGATEDLPDVAGNDAVNIDTEVFFLQHWSLTFQVPATAGGGGGTIHVTPSGLWIPPQPIDSARNITHKATTLTADTFLNCGVLISYQYVRFSQSELGAILSRRN